MAKSKSFFGLRKGSTKTLTFATLDGKQITKDRVTEIRNPRSPGQMLQRMFVTSVGSSYRALKGVCDHSFEGVSQGAACMRTYQSLNLKRLRALYNAGAQLMFNPYQDGNIYPLPYIISRGSLDRLDYSLAVSGLSVKVAGAGFDVSTAEGIYNALGIDRGDYITFVGLEGNVQSDKTIFEPSRVHIIRLAADKTGPVSSAIKAFTIDNAKGVTVSVTATANKVEITVSANLAAGCAIRSHKVADAWQYSDAEFIIASRISSSASTQAAFKTYPASNAKVLDGGSFNDNGPVFVALPGLAQTTYNVAATGTVQLIVNNPDSETVSYEVTSGNSYASVTQSGLVTANNTTEQVQTVQVTVTIGSNYTGIASIKVAAVNAAPGGGGDDGDNENGYE